MARPSPYIRLILKAQERLLPHVGPLLNAQTRQLQGSCKLLARPAPYVAPILKAQKRLPLAPGKSPSLR